MSGNRFNAIVIVDSIPVGELNTARRLHEDLKVLEVVREPSPGVVYARVESQQDILLLPE